MYAPAASRCRRLLTVVPVALALLAPAAADARSKRAARAAAIDACPAASLTPTPGNLADVERTTLCLLNRERGMRGLPRLRASERLADSAAHYSRAMARDNFFSHVSPGGSTMLERIREGGYLRGARRYTVGENLAWGSGRLATPMRAVENWMGSPGHRANILRRGFEEIGVGVATGAPVRLRGDQPAATYTTHFGAKG